MNSRWLSIGAGVLALAAPVALSGGTAAAKAPERTPDKQPTAVGSGGGGGTMSPYATQAAIETLRKGGNAVDGAVAAAATLGVTEPFVAGPGGGGLFVYYNAPDHRVYTSDGREKPPSGATKPCFLDSSGQPMDFETAL